MKKVVIVSFFSAFISPLLCQEGVPVDGIITKTFELNFPAMSSQQGDHFNGGNFIKEIVALGDFYKVKRKGAIEQMILGDFYAPVEFFISTSHESPSGFRMLKDSLSDHYTLEIKYITNYFEENYVLGNMYNITYFPVHLISSFPEVMREQILAHNHNRYMYTKYFVELPEHFQVKTCSFPVSDQFAENLFSNMASFIDNFKARRDSPVVGNNGAISRIISADGYSVEFSAVAGSELRSLCIGHPTTGNAQKMEELCRQILTDAITNEFDESKYMPVLNPLISRHEGRDGGGRFTKKIEYNLEAFNDYANLRSKGHIEKLLLGEFNAPVEFFFSPSFDDSLRAPVGFRMFRDSLDKSYVLDIKCIANYEDAKSVLAEMYSVMGIPENLITSIPEDMLEQMVSQNMYVTNNVLRTRQFEGYQK